jgi:hypothetical protein
MQTQANLPSLLEWHDAFLQSQRAIICETLQNTSIPNSVYAGEFNKYNGWVTSQEELDHHVPLFFCEHIDALQWYCKFWYNHTPFVVESPDVLAALWLQKTCGKSTGNPGGDPVKGLKDAVPESDRILIMNCMYRSGNDWDTASVNFSWCYQGAICGPSNHALTFSDLNLSHGFGAEKIGPLTCALLLYFCIRGMFTKTIMRKTNIYVRGNIISMFSLFYVCYCMFLCIKNTTYYGW